MTYFNCSGKLAMFIMTCVNKVMANAKVSHSVVLQLFIHVDGHYKLIRWKIITHATIDDYSRMILFMKCLNNNNATTISSEQH